MPPPPALTVTDRAALALGVEGVGAEDGTVHGRAGHRAQLAGRDVRAGRERGFGDGGEAPRGSAVCPVMGKSRRDGSQEHPAAPRPCATPVPLARPPPWGKAPTPKPGRRSPHQADAAEAGVQQGREGLVVVEDLSHVGASCREESRLAALETPRLAGCRGQPHPGPPTAPPVPVTCRAVRAALPGDVDGVGARLHAVRPLAAHRAIGLRGGEACDRDLGPMLAGLNPKLTGLKPKSKGQKPTELGSCREPRPPAAWCPEGRAGCPGSPVEERQGQHARGRRQPERDLASVSKPLSFPELVSPCPARPGMQGMGTGTGRRSEAEQVLIHLADA